MTVVAHRFVIGLDQEDCRHIRIGAGVGGLQETFGCVSGIYIFRY